MMAERKKLTVLLTGASGYLGSRLAKRFLNDGYVVLALMRSSSSMNRLGEYADLIRFYDLDDCDYQELLKKHEIDIVVHTATCYGRTQESASDLVKANLIFPLELLEAAIAVGVKAFLNTDTTLPPELNAYALSKREFYEWSSLLVRHKSIRVINVKLEHMYGPKDDASKFPIHVVRACLHNESKLRLTAGEQRRDFIYIDDVVEGYSILLKSLDKISAGVIKDFGLGSGVAVSIREFVEIAHRLCKSKTRLDFGALPYRENESMCSIADNTELYELGWRCETTLESGLMHIIDEERV